MSFLSSSLNNLRRLSSVDPQARIKEHQYSDNSPTIWDSNFFYCSHSCSVSYYYYSLTLQVSKFTFKYKILIQTGCTAVPHHFHHHNRYHRRRIPPAAHHGFRPPMHHPPADMFLSSLPPIIPYENKMHDFPMGGGNPLVDPSRSIRFRLYTR